MNKILEVILDKNQLNVDIPYDMIVENKFPVDWTTTNLEGAVSGLCEYVGYDKNLSARFRNLGAPKYMFK